MVPPFIFNDDILVSASSDKFDNGTEGGPNANKKRRKGEKWSN